MVCSPAVLLLSKIILHLAKPASFLFKKFSQEQLSLDAAYCVRTTGTDESVDVYSHQNKAGDAKIAG